MKRIRNGLVTALLALAIAGGGMVSVFFLLGRVERQALKKETEDKQEEIILTEEETDRLVMLLKVLEEDDLTRIRNGSGANIPEEKAIAMMASALVEMNGLMLGEWVPDISDLIAEQALPVKCELYADQSNLSMEVYKLTYFYQVSQFFSFEIAGILDARSGLLVSLNLAFMNEEDWMGGEEKTTMEKYVDAWASNGKKVYNYRVDEVRDAYPLDFFAASAMNYYALNTNFEFYPAKEYGEDEDCYQMNSGDGEYYLELTQDDGDFHFQLHKFDL